MVGQLAELLRSKNQVFTSKWSEGMMFCTHVLWSYLNIFRLTQASWRWPPLAIISNVIRSHRCTDRITQTTVLNYFFVININYDLSHKHYAPERPVWFIQTLGFPKAITTSVIRSWKTQTCHPRTIKICYWNCFEIKAWTLGRNNASLGTLSAWKIPHISGYIYLLSAAVTTVIGSHYVNMSTQLIPI